MKAIALVLLVVLAGCSSGISPLEKSAPVAVTPDALVTPPWQALVRAGPDAGKDIDMETLNGPQAGAQGGAPNAAPGMLPEAAQIGGIANGPPPSPQPGPPARQAAAPGAIAIKAVAVTGVSGASAIGNRELSAAMAKVMRGAGWPVLAAARQDALSISAQVMLDPALGANQAVKINWVVASPKGKVLGTVAQNNAVPAHSLDASWGDTATAAAEAAAEGIFRLIGQYR